MSLTVRVLAAVIVREGRYLLALRPHGKRHAGHWEFPGGKLEADESDFDALARELREELDVSLLSIGNVRCTQRDGDSPFTIVFVDAQIAGEPRAREHVAIAWVPASELLQYALAPSDIVCAEFITGERFQNRVPEGQRLYHESMIDALVRDARGFAQASDDMLPAYISYTESAAKAASVRGAAVHMLTALAEQENDTARRRLIMDAAARIAALPPPPAAAPPEPRAPSLWLTDVPSSTRVRVRESFRDFDGTLMEAGREFTVLRWTYFPYDSGHTFYCDFGVFRLSDNVPENHEVLANKDHRFFCFVDSADAE